VPCKGFHSCKDLPFHLHWGDLFVITSVVAVFGYTILTLPDASLHGGDYDLVLAIYVSQTSESSSTENLLAIVWRILRTPSAVYAVG